MIVIQHIDEVDEPEDAVLLRIVQLGNILQNDGVEVLCDGQKIRRAFRVHAQFVEGEPCDTMRGLGNMQFTSLLYGDICAECFIAIRKFREEIGQPLRCPFIQRLR